jgi:prephenate dehydrogenase
LEYIAQHCPLIILAVPPEAVGPAALKLVPHLAKGHVLTDVASTKLPVVEFMKGTLPPGISFIPGHPIAGGTRSGPMDAQGDIFARKMVMLTPPLGIDIHDPALQLVKDFWEHMDSVVELMPADFHDLVYAHVSHLPHILAFAASAVLVDQNLHNAPDTFFRFIRLGLSGPTLWTDIFLQNQHYVSHALRTYLAMLSHIREELSQAPDNNASSHKPGLANTVLFPRIAASTLIATVQMLERQSGQRMARYSGAGFATALLSRYQQLLETLAAAIEGGQRKLLLAELESMHKANIQLRQQIGAAI